MMRTQSSAEEPQQRERGRAVQRDDVGEIERRLAAGLRGLGDQRLPAAADPRRHEHGVPEARHREQLGDALDERDHDRLEIGQAATLTAEHEPNVKAEWRGPQEAPRARWSGGLPLNPVHPWKAPTPGSDVLPSE